ncbi:MAG TPA: c-type cytochrome [Candidatus Baltobacteraceae bacterium]|nr:c-type cytochrome [Candidatus Baltobacteraceae bacterium]
MRITILALALSLVACGGNNHAAAPAQKPVADTTITNGRTIFTTGRDAAGVQITASPAPLRSSCEQCHGATGAGGVHIGGAVSADLRHDALTKGQKHPYTIALLERAISTGVDNDGEKLSPVMPRWKMSKADLHAVAVYVYDTLK